MPRPVVDRRVSTAIRLPPDLHDRLQAAARDRDLSVSFLVTRAIHDFLDRLLPVDEIQWTRPAGLSGQGGHDAGR